jgi:hypothetical protein
MKNQDNMIPPKVHNFISESKDIKVDEMPDNGFKSNF